MDFKRIIFIFDLSRPGEYRTASGRRRLTLLAGTDKLADEGRKEGRKEELADR
jgi:hypothetical protein